MSNKRKIKPSIDPQKTEKENKTKNYLFRFDNFEIQSGIDKKITFNNQYMSLLHFLKVNADLVESLKILSQHCYNNTLINGELKKSMHFKILDRDDTIQRIIKIMNTIYNKNIVDQYSEGSLFIEFGRIDDCRYIGVLIDYHIINLLYIDAHHLTCKDEKFDINRKMSYTYPSLLTVNSINSQTRTVGMDINNVFINEINEKYMEQKDKEDLSLFREIRKGLYDGDYTDKEVIELLKDEERKIRDEK